MASLSGLTDCKGRWRNLDLKSEIPAVEEQSGRWQQDTFPTEKRKEQKRKLNLRPRSGGWEGRVQARITWPFLLGGQADPGEWEMAEHVWCTSVIDSNTGVSIMMARAFLTWKGLGAGGGRTSLVAEDNSLLPPSPHIERGVTAKVTIPHWAHGEKCCWWRGEGSANAHIGQGIHLRTRAAFPPTSPTESRLQAPAPQDHRDPGHQVPQGRPCGSLTPGKRSEKSWALLCLNRPAYICRTTCSLHLPGLPELASLHLQVTCLGSMCQVLFQVVSRYVMEFQHREPLWGRYPVLPTLQVKKWRTQRGYKPAWGHRTRQ